jgi:hypothetical protein
MPIIVSRIIVLVVALAVAMPSFGQTFGQITGLITDSTGGVVPNASVTVTNPQTNFTRAEIANAAGVYTFPNLLPGVYNIRVEVPGFQSAIRSGVELQVQQTARLDFKLEVGAVSQAVEVTGGTPLLNTEDATVGTVIDNQRIVDLPLNGRNFLQLVALSPNVSSGFANGGQSTARLGGDRSTQQISVAGSRREWNYFTLDGMSNTDVDFNTYLFLPSIDALQEFKVQTGVYSAEFGREVGQVNVSTKGGTNQYHGTLFEFLRNNKLDALPYGFTAKTPTSAPFKWNQYGFTLAGPIQIPKVFNGKDRLFFMANFEGFKLRNQTQGVYNVPSVAMRGGNFSQILPGAPITDFTNNNQPFAGNIIPTSRLDPISLKLLEFYPAPNQPGSALSANYLSLQSNVTNKNQFTTRIDFVESPKSSWFGRFSWDDENILNPGIDLNGLITATTAEQALIDNTRVFRPNIVNEFRFGYNHFFNDVGPQLAGVRDPIKEFGSPIVDPPSIAWGIPSIGILGFSGFGDNSNSPYLNYNYTFQWTDNVSWTHGAHAIRFGADIRRDRFSKQGNQFPRSSPSFQNQATGYGFSDYMLGYMQTNSDAVALANLQLRATSQSYYVTDTWKLRPNLTLTAGLRYEYTPPWKDRGNSYINAFLPLITSTPNVANKGLHPVLVRQGSGDFNQNMPIRFDPAIQVARDGRMGDRLMAPDRTNFAPRLGIAWSPNSKLTIRAGAGIFFVQDVGNAVFDLGRNFAGRLAPIQVNHNLSWSDPLGTRSSNPCGVSPPIVCVSQPFVLAFPYNHKTPYVEQYELNIQRQISGSMVLEVGYLGNQGHKLERFSNVNQALPGPGTAQSRYPYPELGTLQETDNSVNSNYHSVSAKLTRRLSNGLTWLSGYTFAKAIDNGSGVRVLGSDPSNPQNSYCGTCERGLAIFNEFHRLVNSVVYDLPFGKGRKYMNRGIAGNLIGGWQVNSIVTVGSGFPLTITPGSDRSQTGAGYDRTNAAGISPKLGNRTTGEWFNIQAFALQPLGTYGNAGRNVATGPGIFDWDFSTLKDFYFTEKKYLQLRFEVFNFLNHPNFGDPNLTLGNNRTDANGVPIVGSGSFGTITSTRSGIDMRELQFSLKFVF